MKIRLSQISSSALSSIAVQDRADQFSSDCTSPDKMQSSSRPPLCNDESNVHSAVYTDTNRTFIENSRAKQVGIMDSIEIDSLEKGVVAVAPELLQRTVANEEHVELMEGENERQIGFLAENADADSRVVTNK